MGLYPLTRNPDTNSLRHCGGDCVSTAGAVKRETGPALNLRIFDTFKRVKTFCALSVDWVAFARTRLYALTVNVGGEENISAMSRKIPRLSSTALVYQHIRR